MQESSYELSAKGCHLGLEVLTIQLEHESVSTLEEETKVCSDFGISQIHYRTAESYDMDIDKLTTDLEYSIEAGAKVLMWFHKTYSDKEPFWWVRYNCGTRESIDRVTCNNYKDLVLRYL